MVPFDDKSPFITMVFEWNCCKHKGVNTDEIVVITDLIDQV